jgi:prepilin-type N-terminal cleavage/methylation domain-containing protein
MNVFRQPTVSPRSRAFTLLEIMVAMAIFSAVMAAIYSTWLAVVRSSKVALTAAARVQRARMATRALVDSLLCIQSFGANTNYYPFLADNRGDFTTLIFTSHLPSSFPDAGLFGDQALRRIGFAVKTTNGDNQLIMFQMPLLADMDEAEEPFKIVLAREVSLFLVEFWDLRRNQWDTEWKFPNQLPKLVRVTLGCGPVNPATSIPQTVVSRVIAIPATVVPGLPRGPVQGVPGGGGSNAPPYANPNFNPGSPNNRNTMRQF